MATDSKEKSALNRVVIKEVIVVEGKDDEAAIKRALDAEVIITHGYGISQAAIKRIAEAYERCGIIIFTDPDYAGDNIRKKLTAKFPDAKHAYISREAGTRGSDIGVENASPENIIMALKKSRAVQKDIEDKFTMTDMINAGLCGDGDSAEKREKIGEKLGIGYGNTKTFLRRINRYGITGEEFAKACEGIID